MQLQAITTGLRFGEQRRHTKRGLSKQLLEGLTFKTGDPSQQNRQAHRKVFKAAGGAGKVHYFHIPDQNAPVEKGCNPPNEKATTQYLWLNKNHLTPGNRKGQNRQSVEAGLYKFDSGTGQLVAFYAKAHAGTETSATESDTQFRSLIERDLYEKELARLRRVETPNTKTTETMRGTEAALAKVNEALKGVEAAEISPESVHNLGVLLAHIPDVKTRMREHHSRWKTKKTLKTPEHSTTPISRSERPPLNTLMQLLRQRSPKQEATLEDALQDTRFTSHLLVTRMSELGGKLATIKAQQPPRPQRDNDSRPFDNPFSFPTDVTAPEQWQDPNETAAKKTRKNSPPHETDLPAIWGNVPNAPLSNEAFLEQQILSVLTQDGTITRFPHGSVDIQTLQQTRQILPRLALLEQTLLDPTKYLSVFIDNPSDEERAAFQRLNAAINDKKPDSRVKPIVELLNDQLKRFNTLEELLKCAIASEQARLREESSGELQSSNDVLAQIRNQNAFKPSNTKPDNAAAV